MKGKILLIDKLSADLEVICLEETFWKLNALCDCSQTAQTFTGCCITQWEVPDIKSPITSIPRRLHQLEPQSVRSQDTLGLRPVL